MIDNDKKQNFTRRKVNSLIAAGTAAISLGGSSSVVFGASNPPLYYASLLDVAKLIENGDIRPTELTKLLLNRIDDVDVTLDSYVTVMADHAIASAEKAESEINAGKYRGPLHGVPIGIKDLCYIKGVPNMAGTTVYSDFIPSFNATVVEKLEAAGAVILGKLVLCEGAHGPYHPDLKVPINPWDADRWSGVSSSGSGVATAAGLCFGSIGTDTGGSIRFPSAVNGCVGLKPTYGRVSRYGISALAESMDHIGPMTRTVGDAAAMLEVMSGFDVNDPTTINEAPVAILAEIDKGVEGLKIGFDANYASKNVDTEVAQSVRDVISLLKNLGAEIIEVQMPNTSNVGGIWYDLETAEAVIANETRFPDRADEYGPGFREVLEYGQQLSAVAHARAAKACAEFSARYQLMLDEVDCFVCPSMGNVASLKLTDPAAIETDELWASLVPNDIFAKPANFSGVPTLSVPCGFSEDGLPISAQFIGPRLSEAMICRVGHAFEKNTSWHKKHPSI